MREPRSNNSFGREAVRERERGEEGGRQAGSEREGGGEGTQGHAEVAGDRRG